MVWQLIQENENFEFNFRLGEGWAPPGYSCARKHCISNAPTTKPDYITCDDDEDDDDTI